MSTRRGRSRRQEVVVFGADVHAQWLAQTCDEHGFRAELLGPDSDELDLEASAPRAGIVVDMLDYPLDTKLELLDELLDYVDDGTLILSSLLGVTGDGLSVMTGRYPDIVGFCALEPQTRRVVEVIQLAASEPSALTRAVAFWERLGFSTMQVADTPGGVTARVLACIINEAAWALGEGVATPEAIDAAMKLGASHPEGPLRRADRIGLHRVVAVMRNLHGVYGEERYRLAPALRTRVLRGQLGEAYGAGFYGYTEPSNGDE